MLKRLIILFVPLALCVNSYSQALNKDDLLQDAYSLWSIGRSDSALALLNRSNELSKDGSDPLFKANIHYTKGIIFLSLLEYDSSLANLNITTLLAKELNTSLLYGMSVELKGSIFQEKGNLLEALSHFNQSKAIYEGLSSTKLLGSVYSRIGAVEMLLKDSEKAVNNYQLALKYYLEESDSANIALATSNLANAQSKLKQYSEAFDNFRKAIQLKQRHSSERSIGFTYQYFGEAFLDFGALDSASFYLSKAYLIKGETDDVVGLAETANLLGALALNKQQYSIAKSYLDSAELWAKKANSLSAQIKTLQQKRALYRALGQSDIALELDDLYDVLRDSLFQQEQLKVRELQTEYLVKEQEQEKELIARQADIVRRESSQKTIIIIAIGSILLVLFVLVYFILRSRKLAREKSDLLEAHNLVIEQQKNDIRHRTKNHMSMVGYILGLIDQNTEDSAIKDYLNSARHLMKTFSSVESFLYDLEHENEINLSKYLEEWKVHYLESLPPTKNKYEIELACEDIFVSNDVLIAIGLISTEMATNTLKHVTLKENKDTILKVEVNMENDLLNLMISDNGRGFEPTKSNGMGWRIINTLVSSMRARLEPFEDSGIRIEIPLKRGSKPS